MKSILVGAALVFSLALKVQAACTADDVRVAEELYDNVRARVTAGVVANREETELQYALLRTKFCANQIKKDKYCGEGATLLMQLLTEKKNSLGLSVDGESVARTLGNLVALRTLCSK